MSSEILDLDALLPEPRQVKINGKVIECHPLKVKQLIKLTKLETELSAVENPDDILPKIKEALSPFMPAIQDDDIDFTIEQLKILIQFAQTGVIPEQATKAQEYPAKKKVNSPEELPSSSTTTPATE